MGLSRHAVVLLAALLSLLSSACFRVGFDDKPLGARDASAWTFQVLGDETLQLAGQPPMPCVKLERQPDEPYGQRIELWLARERHFLPVRLRITQGNGDVADQRLAEPPGAN